MNQNCNGQVVDETDELGTPALFMGLSIYCLFVVFLFVFFLHCKLISNWTSEGLLEQKRAVNVINMKNGCRFNDFTAPFSSRLLLQVSGWLHRTNLYLKHPHLCFPLSICFFKKSISSYFFHFSLHWVLSSSLHRRNVILSLLTFFTCHCLSCCLFEGLVALHLHHFSLFFHLL